MVLSLFGIQNKTINGKAAKERAEARTNAGPAEAYARAEDTNHGTGVFSAGAGASPAVYGNNRFMK